MAPTMSASKSKGSPPSVEAQNRTQTKSTTHSSASSPVSARETLGQQRGVGNPAFFADTTVYTQYGVAETFGSERQQPSVDKPSTYKTTIEHHDLLGDGPQAFSAGTMQHEPRTARMEAAFACPYHCPILQERPTNLRSGQGLGPMDRYLAEDPSERYAILHRPDTGSMSTHKGCRCLEIMQRSVDTNGHAQK